jgi:uncharacterized metal-binding protein
MSEAKGCSCSGGTKLIFACSGAADVGEIADRAARQLTKDGVGKMFCLAGVGGRVEGIMKTTESADTILAIDGCPIDCVKQTLEQAGFSRFTHLRVTDLGMEKGHAPAQYENISRVAVKGIELLS